MIRKIILFILLLSTAVAVSGIALGQRVSIRTEQGKYPSISHIPIGSIDASQQVWAVSQDTLGVMYFAHGSGISSYDGATQGQVPGAVGRGIYSIARNQEGVLFVGAQNDFGRLIADENGSVMYQSLVNVTHMPQELIPLIRNAGNFWNIVVNAEGVYFQAWSLIVRYNEEGFYWWHIGEDVPSEQIYHKAFVAGGRVFIREKQVGLKVIENNQLRFIDGSEIFANESVFSVEELEDGQISIGVQNTQDFSIELYLYGNERFYLSQSNIDLKITSRAYFALSLPEGYLAIGTISDGIVFVDRDWNIVRQVTEEDDLYPAINHLFLDMQGNIWASTNGEGVYRLPRSSSLSTYDSGLGIHNKVLDAVRYRDKLFVGTEWGLRSLQFSDEENGELKSFFGEETSYGVGFYALEEVGGTLIVGGEEGVFEYKKDSLEQISRTNQLFGVLNITASRFKPGTAYIGTTKGLWVLTRSSRNWELKEIPYFTHARINSVVESDAGTIWILTGSPETYLNRLELMPDGTTLVDSKEFTVDAVFGSNELLLAIVEEIPTFFPGTGVYIYDDASGQFIMDPRLPLVNNSSRDSLLSVEVRDDVIWMVHSDRVDIGMRNPTGKYEITSPPILKSINWQSPVMLYPEENGVTWIGTDDQLYRYEQTLEMYSESDVAVKPLIRSVFIAFSDVALFGGEPLPLFADALQPGKETQGIILDAEQNDVGFTYAYPDFSTVAEKEFRYYLENHDNGWNYWSNEHTKNYRNLSPGQYTFHLEARTSRLDVSEISEFRFTILPPWYGTFWMKLVYVALFFGVVRMGVKYRRARRDAKELEREREIIKKLNQANKTLVEANEGLKEANIMKDEFMANASHELRTPLTAILGFTSVLKEELIDSKHEFLELIDENGKRLLQTINSMLDLAKLRAGMVDIDMKVINVHEKVAHVSDLLSQLARNKDIFLKVIDPKEDYYIQIDLYCFERILYNLIGNAIKFTNRGGITIELTSQGQWVHIAIQDTGIGIDERFLPHLFEEFKQENDKKKREGSGLGLTITEKLVELMGGHINVKSKKGKGSTFTISFPLVQNGPVLPGRTTEHNEDKEMFTTT